MKPSRALELHRAEIREIVEQNHAKNARVFGSVANGDDTETSDLDLLVDPTEKTTLFDLARIQNYLQKLLRVSVDVLTPKEIPEKYRSAILNKAIVV